MMKRLIPTLVLLLVPTWAWAQVAPSCNQTIINDQGSAGAPITCDATSGGVTILVPRDSRCWVTIENTTANAVNICDGSFATCDASHGYTLVGNSATQPGVLFIGPGSRTRTYKCIRQGGSSGTINTIEEVMGGHP